MNWSEIEARYQRERRLAEQQEQEDRLRLCRAIIVGIVISLPAFVSLLLFLR